ncbi:SURF1 family protein [Piscinibacter koreensis]|uniref:SURF1 family protein n=1 Tax=Piscinibacter koreensis TaxID=2742824 RepID=UPI001C37AE5F|nr:SURF1 family protein [Schlegelella koreensis]
MSTPEPRWRRWTVLVATVLVVALTARLGIWQLDRAAQKTALHELLTARAALPPLRTAELAHDPLGAAAQHYRPVQLEGRWVPEHTIYLENRQLNGVPGFFVVTPLLLASGDAVLVQRGWVARNFADRAAVPPVPTPAGTVTLSGRVAPPPARLYDFAGVASGVIRQNLDLAQFAGETSLRLLPLSVWQLDSTSTPSDGLKRQWSLPVTDVDKHHGYAAQWFALSALAAGLYVWFQLVRPRRRARA